MTSTGVHAYSIEELQKKLKEDMRNTSIDYKGSSPEWVENQAEIKARAMSGSIASFLRWEPILKTMFVAHDTPYIQEELRRMSNSENWGYYNAHLDECPVGLPIASKIASFTTSNLIHQMYHVFMLESYMHAPVASLDFIIEFGGGYGSLCRLIHAMGFKGAYMILDSKVMNLIQAYYLRMCGVEKVMLAHDLENLNVGDGFFNNINSAMIANWSLSECPIEVRETFFNKVKRVKYMQVAYQREFSGINNSQYFKKLASNSDFKFDTIASPARESFYLMGERCADNT